MDQKDLESPKYYDGQYYHSWIRLMPRYNDDFTRLVNKITEDRKKNTYNRENALRSASISMTKTFDDLLEVKDPDFVPNYFPKVKRKVADQFLTRIEHEVKWNLGEFTPLPVTELLANKKFTDRNEMDVWADRLFHTKNVSNIITCKKTGYPKPNHYDCNHRDIPYGTKEAIESFKQKFGDKLKFGSQLHSYFTFMNHNKMTCVFEPNRYNTSFVFGLCIQPRERHGEAIFPPRAELLSFTRSFDCSNIDDHFKYDDKSPLSCYSILTPNTIPTDQPRPKITNLDGIYYSNERSVGGSNYRNWRNKDTAIFHFDESEYQRDMKSLITDHEIGDVEARLADRKDSRLYRTGLDTNKVEFWEYPAED